jgi:hypothetical protein
VIEWSKIGLVLVILIIIVMPSLGQDNPVPVDVQDSVQSVQSDSIQPVQMIDFSDSQLYVTEDVLEVMEVDSFMPDPVHTIWLGAVIPGYGQIKNKKYWKLPIVYGGFLGCFYAVNWNSKQYTSYKNAYLDITDDDATTNSHLEIIPRGFTIDSYGGQAAYTNLLRSAMDRSRYNRDLSIIISVAYYGLTLIDAFVDAHLYDFDVSTDLSLKLRPAIINDRLARNHFSKSSFSYGVTAYLKF